MGTAGCLSWWWVVRWGAHAGALGLFVVGAVWECVAARVGKPPVAPGGVARGGVARVGEPPVARGDVAWVDEPPVVRGGAAHGWTSHPWHGVLGCGGVRLLNCRDGRAFWTFR